ncbi:MAG TPA: ImmA/IrrE family metallo-endopeptidase [Devosia sp.]|nr:ImmA/IrrE family metallo-endopeptidase [Devosia sp.]
MRERDANRFAATILMPPEVVRSILNSEGITNVDVLADRFGVSTAAMTIRLKTMGILPEWA